MAIKVTLRKKPITKGRQSLYLDFYPPVVDPESGKSSRREFLGLHILDNPKTPLKKRVNKETLELAEKIRATRLLEIQNGEYGFRSGKAAKTDFIEYFQTLPRKREGSNQANWMSALKYLKEYSGGKAPMNTLNKEFCEGFRNFLMHTSSHKTKATTKLSQNTISSYFNKFKFALKQAYADGLLKNNLNEKIERQKDAETQREYLSLEELQQLAKTDCEIPIMKRAALFSALTGLRFSDINNLTWRDINYSEAQGY